MKKKARNQLVIQFKTYCDSIKECTSMDFHFIRIERIYGNANNYKQQTEGKSGIARVRFERFLMILNDSMDDYN